jgi:hypothetical protein
MPALITAADAAARIVRGFASGAFEIHFRAVSPAR